MELATFCFVGQCPTNYVTPGRAVLTFLKASYNEEEPRTFLGQEQYQPEQYETVRGDPEPASLFPGKITVPFLPLRGFQGSWEVSLAGQPGRMQPASHTSLRHHLVLPTFALLGKQGPKEGLAFVLGHLEMWEVLGQAETPGPSSPLTEQAMQPQKTLKKVGPGQRR